MAQLDLDDLHRSGSLGESVDKRSPAPLSWRTGLKKGKRHNVSKPLSRDLKDTLGRIREQLLPQQLRDCCLQVFRESMRQESERFRIEFTRPQRDAFVAMVVVPLSIERRTEVVEGQSSNSGRRDPWDVSLLPKPVVPRGDAPSVSKNRRLRTPPPQHAQIVA